MPASRSCVTATRICCSEMPVSSSRLTSRARGCRGNRRAAATPIRPRRGPSARRVARPVVELAVADPGPPVPRQRRGSPPRRRAGSPSVKSSPSRSACVRSDRASLIRSPLTSRRRLDGAGPRYPRRAPESRTSGRTSRRVRTRREVSATGRRARAAGCSRARSRGGRQSSSARSALPSPAGRSGRRSGAIAWSISAASRSAAARTPRRCRARCRPCEQRGDGAQRRARRRRRPRRAGSPTRRSPRRAAGGRRPRGSVVAREPVRGGLDGRRAHGARQRRRLAGVDGVEMRADDLEGR